MASLREQLESLTKTAPAIQDLEDPDDADGTTSALRASLAKSREEGDDEASQLQQKRRIGGLRLIDDEGRYAGVRASKVEIFGDSADISGIADRRSDDSDGFDDQEDEDESEDDEEKEFTMAHKLKGSTNLAKDIRKERWTTGDSGDKEDRKLRPARKSKGSTDLVKDIREGVWNVQDSGDSDEDGGSGSDEGSSVSEDERESESEDREKSEESMDEEDEGEDLQASKLLSHSSTITPDAQRKKGMAVRSQLALWDQLLLVRIRLHSALGVFNELPRGELARTLIKEADDETKQKLRKARSNIMRVVWTLLETEDALLKGCPQTKALVSTSSGNAKNEEDAKSDDEEIESSEDEKEKQDAEEFEDDSGEETPDYKGSTIDEDSGGEHAFGEGQKSKKKMRKPTVDQLAKRLQMSEKRFEQFRKSTLSKWDEKTRLVAPSKSAKKDFSAFEGSILQQIEKVMSDKSRLLRRIRQKRSDVERIGGDPQADDDVERFDDDDFYQQLLKELIERKSAAVNVSNDPAMMSRQWLELEKLRSKRAKKKKVDTKASKGRKIRYVTIPKLVNYQNAVPEAVEWTHEARNELFKSLFA